MSSLPSAGFPWGRLTSAIRFSLFAVFGGVVLARGGKIPLVWDSAALTLFSLGILSLKSPRSVIDLLRHPLFPGVAGALLWQFLALAFAPSAALGFGSVQKTWAVVTFGVLAGRFWTERDRRRFHGLVLALGAGQATLLLASRGFNMSTPLLFPGNPLYAALWMIVSFFLTFHGLFEKAEPPRKTSRMRRPFFLGLFAALAAGIFLLHVRSALVALAGGIFAYAGRRFGRRGMAGALAAFGLTMALVPAATWGRILKMDDPVSWKRADIWRAAAEGIVRNPVWGWGPGHYESLDRATASPQNTFPVRYEMTTSFAHNDYLQAAAETGIPGAVFWIFALGVFILRPPGGARAAAVSAVGAAGAVISLFNFPWVLPADGLLLAGVLGLPLASAAPPPQVSRALRATVDRSVMGDGFRPLAVQKSGPGVVAVVRGFAWVLLAGLGGGSLLLAAGDASRLLGREASVLDRRWGEDRLSQAEGMLHDKAKGENPQRVDDARDTLMKVLGPYPNRAEAWRLLGHLEADHAVPPRFSEAVAAYGRALSLWPLHAPWRFELAAAWEAAGKPASALAEWHRTLSLEPSYGDAAIALGRALRLSGRPGRAEGWMVGLLRRWDEAPESVGEESAYRRIVLRRDRPAALRELALCQMGMKKYKEALRTLRSLAQLATPGATAAGGRPSLSDGAAEPLIRSLPDGDAEGKILEAGCHFFLGDFAKAESLLRIVQRWSPDRPDVSALLERVRSRRRR